MPLNHRLPNARTGDACDAAVRQTRNPSRDYVSLRSQIHKHLYPFVDGFHNAETRTPYRHRPAGAVWRAHRPKGTRAPLYVIRTRPRAGPRAERYEEHTPPLQTIMLNS